MDDNEPWPTGNDSAGTSAFKVDYRRDSMRSRLIEKKPITLNKGLS